MNKIVAVLTIIAILVGGTLGFDAPLISGLMALLVFMLNF
jgi:hypothetical protein